MFKIHLIYNKGFKLSSARPVVVLSLRISILHFSKGRFHVLIRELEIASPRSVPVL